ncbi:unnamed protein product [Rotaria sordida]|uniref:Uncharacterized protein n=1 Tax=Rotaria sordida TaxID=392033 RepID=A0A815EXC3_9BILA|nr:unnamed protein product [Rotaria sordida]CAF1316019.1 unnamed protein product [Rotaria sordida]
MSKSLDLFVNALDAIDNENFNEAIQALNTIIDRYPAPVGEKNKPILIRLLKHRCQAHFALGNYKGRSSVDEHRLYFRLRYFAVLFKSIFIGSADIHDETFQF